VAHSLEKWKNSTSTTFDDEIRTNQYDCLNGITTKELLEPRRTRLAVIDRFESNVLWTQTDGVGTDTLSSVGVFQTIKPVSSIDVLGKML